MSKAIAGLVMAVVAVAASLAVEPSWAQGRHPGSTGARGGGPAMSVSQGSMRAPPRFQGHRSHGHSHHSNRHFGASIYLAPVPLMGLPHSSWYYGYGAPYPYPYNGYGGYVYGPPVVVAPSQPPVYIERPDASADSVYGTQPQPAWYWCDNPRGYYPEVSECPGGWRAVAPSPSQ